jgi:hypothetical protein
VTDGERFSRHAHPRRCAGERRRPDRAARPRRHAARRARGSRRACAGDRRDHRDDPHPGRGTRATGFRGWSASTRATKRSASTPPEHPQPVPRLDLDRAAGHPCLWADVRDRGDRGGDHHQAALERETRAGRRGRALGLPRGP